jgi:hypothetical protein
MYGATDITYDFALIDYLFSGILASNPDEQERVEKLARSYRAWGTDLQRQLPQLPGLPGLHRWATVPPVS